MFRKYGCDSIVVNTHGETNVLRDGSTAFRTSAFHNKNNGWVILFGLRAKAKGILSLPIMDNCR